MESSKTPKAQVLAQERETKSKGEVQQVEDRRIQSQGYLGSRGINLDLLYQSLVGQPRSSRKHPYLFGCAFHDQKHSLPHDAAYTYTHDLHTHIHICIYIFCTCKYKHMYIHIHIYIYAHRLHRATYCILHLHFSFYMLFVRCITHYVL